MGVICNGLGYMATSKYHQVRLCLYSLHHISLIPISFSFVVFQFSILKESYSKR